MAIYQSKNCIALLMTSEACSDYLTKPLPGHAICNLGDAMFFFSGGILRSNIHRVV